MAQDNIDKLQNWLYGIGGVCIALVIYSQNSQTLDEVFFYGLIISVIIFLILREFWCWYFKINQRITNQTQTIKLLKDIKDLQQQHLAFLAKNAPKNEADEVMKQIERKELAKVIQELRDTEKNK